MIANKCPECGGYTLNEYFECSRCEYKEGKLVYAGIPDFMRKLFKRKVKIEK